MRGKAEGNSSVLHTSRRQSIPREPFGLSKAPPVPTHSVIGERCHVFNGEIPHLPRFLSFPYLLLEIWNPELFQAMLECLWPVSRFRSACNACAKDLSGEDTCSELAASDR